MISKKTERIGSGGVGQSESFASISYVCPAAGLNNENNTVIIGGVGLDGITSVNFGSQSCAVVRSARDGTRLTVTVRPDNKQSGKVTVTAGSASVPNAYDFVRPVVGYRVFVKKSTDGDTWENAKYGKFQESVPGQTSYSIRLVDDEDESLLPWETDDTNTVYKVTVCAMLDKSKIILLDPDPKVATRSDHQYPLPGDRGSVAWLTGQIIMPSSIRITSSQENSSLTLLWLPAKNLYVRGFLFSHRYRIFRKPVNATTWTKYKDVSNEAAIVETLDGFDETEFLVTPIGEDHWNHDSVVYFGAPNGMALPNNQSNQMLAYGLPKLVDQFPKSYGQAFVLYGSIGSMSISAFFEYMGNASSTGNTNYVWQINTDENADPTKWSDLRLSNVTGERTSVLTFGAANQPVDSSNAGWYRVKARNKAVSSRVDGVFSTPVRVYVGVGGAKPTPALISQSYTAGQTVYVEPETNEQGFVSTLFNNDSGAGYLWEYSAKSPTGPYEHSEFNPGAWRDIGGYRTRTMWFGEGFTRSAGTTDSGWYRLKMIANGHDAFSDPVYIKVGDGGNSRLAASATDEHVVSQYPMGGDEIIVPWDARSAETWVGISAYPPMVWQPEQKLEYTYTLTWEKSADGLTGWTNLCDSKRSKESFPQDKDVSNRNSTLLRFTPDRSEATFSQYKDRVSGWYRLRAVPRNRAVGMTAALTGGGKTKLEILSKPVQVTVVESGQGRPALLNQSEGIFAAETGSVGAVSIGAYFSNMGGVGNGYRWQRAPDSGTPPSQTSSDWKDTIPAPRTIIGLGTPTLTFGISGAGAQVASTGWYRLIADNQYDVEVFSDPIRLIIQDTSKFGQPSVGIIGPRQGSVKGGTLVSVKGKNLVGASVVTFGGVAGWNVVVARSAADGSSDELTVITPAHAAGTVNLFIKTPGGSVTKAFTFT